MFGYPLITWVFRIRIPRGMNNAGMEGIEAV
jgi:hypothetical protein